ncbi:MAG TPA: hypothetical protein VGC66_23545 [Pyrinomonadaceae bacterium]
MNGSKTGTGREIYTSNAGSVRAPTHIPARKQIKTDVRALC